uniref:Uncharacterized protein n=1 Tax=Astyanax mexicanus TaxID=7994 RepID=A0A8B9L0J1_ASTMX
QGCPNFFCCGPEGEIYLKSPNYGGVYVGLPADLCNVTAAQTPSMHKGQVPTTACTRLEHKKTPPSHINKQHIKKLHIA